MNDHQLFDLPRWDDERFNKEDDEGESWKPNPARVAAKALYEQWQQVFFLLKGVADELAEPNKEESALSEHIMQQIIGDAYLVGAKIGGAEAAGIYIARMDNAAIVRRLAQDIASSLLVIAAEGMAEESYVTVIRGEIDKFRELFIAWVNCFKQDEFEDEWGLFV